MDHQMSVPGFLAELTPMADSLPVLSSSLKAHSLEREKRALIQGLFEKPTATLLEESAMCRVGRRTYQLRSIACRSTSGSRRIRITTLLKHSLIDSSLSVET
jgi:hypothetical protein